MKSHWFSLTTMMLAFVPAADFAPAAAAEKPVWNKDLARAQTIARQTKRPLFVVFR